MLLLVTDHGFLNELDHVWETLEDVDGGGNFLDAQFRWSSHSQTQQRREEASKAGKDAATEHTGDIMVSNMPEHHIIGPDLE